MENLLPFIEMTKRPVRKTINALAIEGKILIAKTLSPKKA
jgi:hypothetical protein